MKIGIDVSAWQGVIDWEKARANGAAFVFIKASQQLFRDRCFSDNWHGSQAAGLPRGAYHYLTWDVSPGDQAHFFARLLKDDPGELSPVVDFEESAGCPPQSAARLRTFIQEVESILARPCMVYTSPGFWQAHGSQDAFFSLRPLWLAHWGVERPGVPPPWKTFAFWQFTSKGDGAAFGVSSRGLDCSYAREGVLPVCSETKPTSAIPGEEQLARLWAAHPELHG